MKKRQKRESYPTHKKLFDLNGNYILHRIIEIQHTEMISKWIIQYTNPPTAHEIVETHEKRISKQNYIYTNIHKITNIQNQVTINVCSYIFFNALNQKQTKYKLTILKSPCFLSFSIFFARVTTINSKNQHFHGLYLPSINNKFKKKINNLNSCTLLHTARTYAKKILSIHK